MIDWDVIAVALSLVTVTPIAMPTAFVPAALPLDDVVAVSVCVAVDENAPLITSGFDKAPTVAVALLFTIAIAAEMPMPVPSEAIAPLTAVVVSVYVPMALKVTSDASERPTCRRSWPRLYRA